MSWRVVVISSRAKLDMQMNYLVIRREDVKKVHLSEIAVLVIESTSVSVTVALLAELVKRKVKVIFCDEKRNPSSELVSYYGSHDTSSKIKAQIGWSPQNKGVVWSEIVREKLRQQKEFLHDLHHVAEAGLIESYMKDIKFADSTNREGHAAKVYFNAVFGMDFTRSDDCSINAALNYGYSIILSAFTREIAINGYMTQIGIFHDNMFNHFNLASDLMEPFRPLVDRLVYSMSLDEFTHDEKMTLVNVLNDEVILDGKRQFVINAIKIYTRSIFDALNDGDIALIRFYRNEL